MEHQWSVLTQLHPAFTKTYNFDLSDPYVNPLVFAQTLCDDFSIGLGLGNSSESARRKFIDQVVSSIQEQVTDFKNHRVEVEGSKPSNKPPTVITPLPLSGSKPVSTIGGLTVNGLNAERSRSTTPLPGERSLSKKSSFVGLSTADSGIGKKRARSRDGPEGVGIMEDEDQEWWERWRKRMRVLDAAAVNAKKLAGKKPPKSTSRMTASPRKKSRTKPKSSTSRHEGIPTNGIKVEVSEHDFKNALVKTEEPDEFQKELLFVDDNEAETDTGYNEELRIPIKVCFFFIWN